MLSIANCNLFIHCYYFRPVFVHFVGFWTFLASQLKNLKQFIQSYLTEFYKLAILQNQPSLFRDFCYFARLEFNTIFVPGFDPKILVICLLPCHYTRLRLLTYIVCKNDYFKLRSTRINLLLRLSLEERTFTA